MTAGYVELLVTMSEWVYEHDQLQFALIAHFVEHYTDIAEVKGLNPFQAWNLFRFQFHKHLTDLSYVYNCHVNHVLISFSEVQSYDRSYIHLQQNTALM